MATLSSVLAWRIPGSGDPGGLPSMGSHRVRHNWSDLAVAAARHCQAHSQNKGLNRASRLQTIPLRCFLLENSRDRGAWWAAVFGVAQSWTRLKWLSSSSSSRVSFLLGKFIGVEGLYGGCMFSFLRNLCPWFLTKMHGTVIWKYSKRNQSYLGNSDSGIGGTLKKGGSETWALLVHVVLNIRVIKALKNSYRNFIKFL